MVRARGLWLYRCIFHAVRLDAVGHKNITDLHIVYECAAKSHTANQVQTARRIGRIYRLRGSRRSSAVGRQQHLAAIQHRPSRPAYRPAHWSHIPAELQDAAELTRFSAD
jgi:hypothetical protein